MVKIYPKKLLNLAKLSSPHFLPQPSNIFIQYVRDILQLICIHVYGGNLTMSYSHPSFAGQLIVTIVFIIIIPVIIMILIIIILTSCARQGAEKPMPYPVINCWMLIAIT